LKWIGVIDIEHAIISIGQGYLNNKINHKFILKMKTATKIKINKKKGRERKSTHHGFPQQFSILSNG
jgi:ribosomal protein L21